ncbi:hypothetical protein TNCV_247731 [Trichonephila clavipes]|nr:hypothetical protein TNCV_247731 [Trichonephila clavipes]
MEWGHGCRPESPLSNTQHTKKLQPAKKIVPSREESSVIICVCRPEEVADASTLQRMLGAPAVQHLQRSLQPVRDEGRFL